MSETGTPRTDALFKQLIDEGCDFTRPANVMDRHARQLETELAAAQRQIASIGHVATGATEAYYDADATITDLRQKLSAAQEKIKAMEGDAEIYRWLLRQGGLKWKGIAVAIDKEAAVKTEYRRAIDASIAKEAERG